MGALNSLILMDIMLSDGSGCSAAFPAAVALAPILGVTLGDCEMEMCSKNNETNMLAEPCG